MNLFTPIELTPKAIEEVKNIIQNKNIPDGYCLRIGVKGGGGCSGVSYMLGFDQKKETDKEYEIEEVKVIIEKKQVMFLAGLTVDFHESAEARGFIFISPNEKEAN